ncbi:hypothetical protein [Desulfobulbus sp.]|uniref:hypothetical protein n=1 Tax=Desulfobulbus sp. TaxID=895 RepID=UPI00286F8E9C|nr:hypothetical protein [Desulfobulbus sp.]
MTSIERVATLEKLDGIVKTASHLKASLAGQEPDVQAALNQIWDVTQQLQRKMCNQAALEACRQDVLDQLIRAGELISECGPDLDDHQRASIGYAGELVFDKVRKFLRMNDYAAQMGVGESVTGEAA